MSQSIPRVEGGRRVPRPATVAPCPACREPSGANYATCTPCRQTIDALWLADWAALLDAEKIAAGSADERLLAEVVAVDIDAYTWTVVDVALTHVKCPECAAELCGGPLSCTHCAFVFGNLWAYDHEAGQQGVMTFNEHMIRVGRMELRHPHRFPPYAAEYAKWLMPIGITNPVRIAPAKMQAIYAALDAGTITREETRWDNSFEAIYAKAMR